MTNSKKHKYSGLITKFHELFNRKLSDDEIDNKTGGIIGDESLELGIYVWSKDYNYIEYYVHWLPHYRGDSHGIIYKDGKHEHLETLSQIGPITPKELSFRRELVDKGLIYCPIISKDKKTRLDSVKKTLLSITKIWHK